MIRNLGILSQAAAQELGTCRQRTKAIPSLLHMKMTVRKSKSGPQCLENGMAVSIGQFASGLHSMIIKYRLLYLITHLRGAAGGAVLMAELLCAKGYLD